MKICPKCTAQNGDNARFCTSCGAELTEAPPPPRPEAPQPAAQRQKPAAPARKISPKVWIAAASAAVILVAVVGLVLSGRFAATTMHLAKMEGTVEVFNDKGNSVTPKENLKLYNGYSLETGADSFAWIELDAVRRVKLDQNSEVEIQKEEDELWLEVLSGSLFIQTAEPPADAGTMDIRSGSMILGVQDAVCGWVSQDAAALLKGTVELTAAARSVTVSAGEMARLSTDENGGRDVEVLPFAEEYIAPFALAELKGDAKLSAAVLEASGLDAQNPPDPAERLMAEYQEIIGSRVIFDSGTAEGASHTMDGVTYASQGLGDAILFDLNGDGLDELILLTDKAGRIWVNGTTGVCINMEIYGPVMGRAALYGSAPFESDDLLVLPRNFRICSKDGEFYINMVSGVQDVQAEYLWKLEDNELTLVASGGYGGIGLTGYTHLPEDEYTSLELLPAELQRRNAFLSVLGDTASPIMPMFARLIGEGADMELYCLSGLGDYADLDKYTWDSARSGLQCTKLEFDMRYAKLIDMDQDGEKELLLAGAGESRELEYDPNVVVYSWPGSEMRKTTLDVAALEGERAGLYRSKTNGNLYFGSSSSGSLGRTAEFVSIADRVEVFWRNPEYGMDLSGMTSEEIEAIWEEAEEEWAEADAQADLFELIESIDFESCSLWSEDMSSTIEEVERQLQSR